jgi:DNA gyrase/topoisomerase IV subunit B
LCENLQITVYKGEDRFQQNYVRGVAQHDLEVSHIADGRCGTEVILKPDSAIFGNIVFSPEILCDWLVDRAAGIADFEFDVRNIVSLSRKLCKPPS